MRLRGSFGAGHNARTLPSAEATSARSRRDPIYRSSGGPAYWPARSKTPKAIGALVMFDQNRRNIGTLIRILRAGALPFIPTRALAGYSALVRLTKSDQSPLDSRRNSVKRT